MAHFIGCCCGAECTPSTYGCSEANTGVTGGICAGASDLINAWELEVEGITVNDQFCEISAECDNCYKPRHSGADAGPLTCLETRNVPAADCYVYSEEDINGTYLVSFRGCCAADTLLEFDVDTSGTPGPTYNCPSCAGGAASYCPYEGYLKYLLDLQDWSGHAQFPGPVGAKMCLYAAHTSSEATGCSWPDSTVPANIYFRNEIFRSVNATLNCTTRNIWHNEITTGEAREITTGSDAGAYVMPRYYGGTITMRPICE